MYTADGWKALLMASASARGQCVSASFLDSSIQGQQLTWREVAQRGARVDNHGVLFRVCCRIPLESIRDDGVERVLPRRVRVIDEVGLMTVSNGTQEENHGNLQ